MNNTSTKVLLVLIAIALWGQLLRPLLTPTSVRAQAQQQKMELQGSSINPVKIELRAEDRVTRTSFPVEIRSEGVGEAVKPFVVELRLRQEKGIMNEPIPIPVEIRSQTGRAPLEINGSFF